MQRPAIRQFSFGAHAAAYDRLRPSVPAEIVDRLVPRGCGRILDLAAGTGLVTRDLVTRVPRVCAVEPDHRMLSVLRRSCPQALVLQGTAQRIPLADTSVDAVVVFGAWHWFAEPEGGIQQAVTEIARVLRPGGQLSVGWNHRDTSVDWLAELVAITERDHSAGQQPGLFTLPEGAPFSRPERASRRWTRTTPRRDLVPLLGTYSSVLDRPAPDQRPYSPKPRTMSTTTRPCRTTRSPCRGRRSYGAARKPASRPHDRLSAIPKPVM